MAIGTNMAAGAVDDDGDGRGGGRKPTFAHYKDKETGASVSYFGNLPLSCDVLID